MAIHIFIDLGYCSVTVRKVFCFLGALVIPLMEQRELVCCLFSPSATKSCLETESQELRKWLSLMQSKCLQ